MSSLQQQPDSPLADLCTEAGRQQADSIIVSFFSADSPTGMFKQLPTDMAAQQALLSSVDRQLPPEAQQECEGPDEGITLAELHSALKASARGKKPGSDGLPYEFYTQFWDLLGPELLAVLQDSFQTQLTPSLPASMTQGVITLLYKGKGARSSLDSYRPITLLNSDYIAVGQGPSHQTRSCPSARDRPHSDCICAWPLDWGQCPFFFFFFFFLGGKDIHYTSAMIATSRVCDVHHKPERPKLTTHLEIFRHES